MEPEKVEKPYNANMDVERTDLDEIFETIQ
jgi:hypothetical protein